MFAETPSGERDAGRRAQVRRARAVYGDQNSGPVERRRRAGGSGREQSEVSRGFRQVTPRGIHLPRDWS